MSRASFTDQSALAVMAALAMCMKRGGRSRRVAVHTPEQIAAADTRTERQRWNDEVEARKAAKKVAALSQRVEGAGQ